MVLQTIQFLEGVRRSMITLHDRPRLWVAATLQTELWYRKDKTFQRAPLVARRQRLSVSPFEESSGSYGGWRR